MSRRITLTVVLAAVTATLGISVPASAEAKRCPHAGKPPAELTMVKARNAIFCLINQRRRGKGLRALRRNDRLGRSALKHSRNMKRRKFFSHIGPNGSTPLSRIRKHGYLAGSSNWGIGEVIRWGPRGQGSPKSAVNKWMRSASHRGTLLNRRYRHLGIGVAIGSPIRGRRGRNSAIYTVDFGYR